MRCLTLIGMPGSGKSAVGRIVAQRLGWRFLDTDKVIERRQGRALQEVLDDIGEDEFRRIEEETISELEVTEPTVISTGGSVVYSARAMAHLAGISTVVFLDATLEAIGAHVASEAPRGIVGMARGGLPELYRERLPLYRQHAQVTVTLGEEGADEAAAEVLSALRLDREEH